MPSIYSPTVPGPAFSALGGGRFNAGPSNQDMNDDQQRQMLAQMLPPQAAGSPYQSQGMAVSGGMPRPMPMMPVASPPPAPMPVAPQAASPGPNVNAAQQAQANFAARQAAAPHPALTQPMGRLGQAVARARNMAPGMSRGPVGGSGPAI